MEGYNKFVIIIIIIITYDIIFTLHTYIHFSNSLLHWLLCDIYIVDIIIYYIYINMSGKYQ
jgi:hypothetical protein